MSKCKIAAFSVVSILLLTVLFSFSYVIDNYNSQNNVTVMSFQRVADSEDEEEQNQSEDTESKTIVGYYYQDDEGSVYMVSSDELPKDNRYEYTPVYSDDQIITNTKGGLQLLNPAIKTTLTELTFEDYENYLKLYDNMDETSAYCELEEATVEDEQILPALVTKNYFENNNITVQGGFTNTMVEKNQRTAVVSKTFGQKLFYGKSPINKTFKMNGVRYKIVGVYDDKNDSLNNIFKDGKERIYLNYTGYSGYENETIDAISYDGNSKIARNMVMCSFKNLEKLNFDEKNLAVNSFGSVVLFIVSMVLIVYLLKLWFINLNNSVDYIKNNHKNKYFGEMLVHNSWGLAIRLLFFIGLPLLIVLTLWLSFKDFHIVESYIHKENLFNIGYMFDTLINTIQKESCTTFSGNTYFLNLYNGTLIMLFGITLIFAILFFIWFYLFSQLNRNNILVRTVAVASFFVIAVVSMISSFVNSTTYIFYTITALLTGVMLLKTIRDKIILS
jgi:hypothetical protein